MPENYPNGPQEPLSDLTDKTRAFYQLKATSEVRRFERVTGQPWDQDAIAFVDSFLERQTQVKANTWRLLRASVRYFLTQQGADPAAIARLESSVGQQAERARVARSEARKRARKQFPREALDALLEALESDSKTHGGEYDRFIAAWLRANLEIGLRPAEWEHMQASRHETEDGERFLVFVRNAKATHGRGNGEFRTLFVTRAVYLLVRRAIEMRDRLLEFGLDWATLQHKMRIRLYVVRQDIPAARHVCLYSTRHQVIADAKSAGKTPSEIAAMVGHNSEETHQRHYGKARVGRGISQILSAQGSSQPQPQGATFATKPTHPQAGAS